MSALERALRELESATAIVAAPTQDLAAAREAMARRQRAIADLFELTGALHVYSMEEREDALRRLRLAMDAGAAAEQWLVASKSEAMAEWNQWSRIYRALGAACASKSTLIDCRG